MITQFVASSARLFIAVVLFAVFFGATLGIALRVVPTDALHEPDEGIHTCVNNATGAMREVSHPNRCRSYEHEVELSEPVIPGYQHVVSGAVAQPGTPTTARAFCPPGKEVIGGGGATNLGSGLSPLLSSIPRSTLVVGPNTHWEVTYFNDQTGPINVIAHAICANSDRFMPR